MSKGRSSRPSTFSKSTIMIISGVLFVFAAAGIGIGVTSLLTKSDDAKVVQGPKGDKGDTGAAGTQGPPGQDGAKGDTGAAGTQGPPGQDGAKGDKGVAGKDGNDGKDGKDGNDGSDGTDGQNAEVKEGQNWTSTTENDPIDATRQLKTLRISKEVTTEAQLEEVYNDLNNKSIAVNTFNELLLPYHTRGTITEAVAKEKLRLTNLTADQFGYIFNKEDYKGVSVPQISYNNTNIVEVNLPGTIETLTDSMFRDNKIRKVNWEELTELQKTGASTFYNNRLNGDLDLSGLTNCISIGTNSFAGNYISGTLTLPVNTKIIDQGAFNSDGAPRRNEIKGTLLLPGTIESIGDNAFMNNEIEVLDWSKAVLLKQIQPGAFKNNKLKTLTFNENTPLNLIIIGEEAFAGNPGINGNGEMITTNIILGDNLETIGKNAIKVKDGIDVSVGVKGATGIVEDSFDGKVTITQRQP